MVPAVLELLAGSLLLDFYFIPPMHIQHHGRPQRSCPRHFRRRVLASSAAQRRRHLA
jgi:hypothetical protein